MLRNYSFQKETQRILIKTDTGCLKDCLLNKTCVDLNLLKKGVYSTYIDRYLELFGIINKTAKATLTYVAYRSQVTYVLNK